MARLTFLFVKFLKGTYHAYGKSTNQEASQIEAKEGKSPCFAILLQLLEKQDEEVFWCPAKTRRVRPGKDSNPKEAELCSTQSRTSQAH